MKNHVAWVVISIVSLIWLGVISIFVDGMDWLPAIIAVVSITFSMLSIYGGAITAAKTEPDKRGAAIASAVIGGMVFWTALIAGIVAFMPI